MSSDGSLGCRLRLALPPLSRERQVDLPHRRLHLTQHRVAPVVPGTDRVSACSLQRPGRRRGTSSTHSSSTGSIAPHSLARVSSKKRSELRLREGRNRYEQAVTRTEDDESRAGVDYRGQGGDGKVSSSSRSPLRGATAHDGLTSSSRFPHVVRDPIQCEAGEHFYRYGYDVSPTLHDSLPGKS